MKLLAVFLFVFIVNGICIAQSKFFTGGDDDYSVLINQNVVTKSLKKEDGGYVDYYVLRENGSFVYLISVSRVELPTNDPDFLYGKEFRESYVSECNCEIVDSKKYPYRNFTGVRFIIKSNLDGNSVKGFSVSTVSLGKIFNINFFTTDAKFDSLISEHEAILNSMVFK